MLHLFGPFSLRTRTLFTSIMIVSLLAGLVPPPLLSSMAGNVVPEAMAETVAQRATDRSTRYFLVLCVTERTNQKVFCLTKCIPLCLSPVL